MQLADPSQERIEYLPSRYLALDSHSEFRGLALIGAPLWKRPGFQVAVSVSHPKNEPCKAWIPWRIECKSLVLFFSFPSGNRGRNGLCRPMVGTGKVNSSSPASRNTAPHAATP